MSQLDHPRWVIQGAAESWDGRGMVAARMTPDHVRSVRRVAGWPLVNMHNRLGTTNENPHRTADGSLT
jgi:hypothetical protein